LLGSGLHEANHLEDALSVKEAELSMERRLGAPEEAILAVQSNMADTYAKLGQYDRALRVRRTVYSGTLKLEGKESNNTLLEANNYASVLLDLERFEDAKSLLRRTMPVARRVLGEGHRLTLKFRKNYARALREDPAATLDDLREAVTTLEDVERVVRRMMGGAHPLTTAIEDDLRHSRAALRARETPPPRTFAKGWLDGLS